MFAVFCCVVGVITYLFGSLQLCSMLPIVWKYQMLVFIFQLLLVTGAGCFWSSYSRSKGN